MSWTPCTRCGRTLPPDVVRELEWGTRCPFCAAVLERPRTDSRLRTRTPTGRASVLASTIVGHTTGHQASPAPPNAAAWLSSLLRAKAWETSPAMPAVGAAPPAPAPTVASATPSAPLAIVTPPAPLQTAASPAPLETPAPPAPDAHRPPPTPIEALPELPVTAFDTSAPKQIAPLLAAPPPVGAAPSPTPPADAVAAPRAPASDLETDAVPLPPVAQRGRVLFAVGAVVLGGALALVLRGSPAEAPAAQVDGGATAE